MAKAKSKKAAPKVDPRAPVLDAPVPDVAKVMAETTKKAAVESGKQFPTMVVLENEPAKKCKCSHGRDMHYGSAADWCNTSGCVCQGWEAWNG